MLRAIQVGFGLAIGVGVAYLALIAAIIGLPIAAAYAITYPEIPALVALALVVEGCWKLFNRPPD